MKVVFTFRKEVQYLGSPLQQIVLKPFHPQGKMNYHSPREPVDSLISQLKMIATHISILKQ